MATLAPLHIFYAGTHTDQHGRSVTFTAADVAATATAYDPALLEAPLVIGHPQTDDPAYGWVEALVLAGAQYTDLEAIPHKVDPAFAELVNAERFNRISASFFLPDAPGNPAPGVYYLRHVGFLGAAAPALKGLRKPRTQPIALAAETEIVTLEFSLSTPPTEIVMADSVSPAAAVDFAAREAALAKMDAELNAKAEAQADADRALKAREAALAQADAERAREKALAFAESHVQAGRLLPRQQAGLVELLLALPETALEFAEADGQTVKTAPRTWLEQFLKDLPAQVDYTEHSAESSTHADGPPAHFAAPPGYTVDASSLALHRRAHALATHKNIPYADAIRQLTGGV